MCRRKLSNNINFNCQHSCQLLVSEICFNNKTFDNRFEFTDIMKNITLCVLFHSTHIKLSKKSVSRFSDWMYFQCFKTVSFLSHFVKLRLALRTLAKWLYKLQKYLTESQRLFTYLWYKVINIVDETDLFSFTIKLLWFPLSPEFVLWFFKSFPVFYLF